MSNPHQHEHGASAALHRAAVMVDKEKLLRDYVAAYGCVTIVETGLYEGSGSGIGIQDVAYVAIDYQAANIAKAKGYRPDGLYYCGDSAAMLARFLSEHDYPGARLFWLDAHAIFEDEPVPTVCTVLGELAAIEAWPHVGSSVVLIDDLWGFGSVKGWPSLGELREAADRLGLHRFEDDGVMRLTP